MGRSIDRLMINILAAFVLYIFFLNVTGSIAAGAIMAFLSMALLHRLTGRIPRPPRFAKRRATAKARAALEQLSLTDAEDAKNQLRRLLEQAYPNMPADIPIECILRHPEGSPVSPDEVIHAWRAASGSDRAVVAALPPADASALALATRLRHPEISIVDGGALVVIAAKHPLLDAGETFTAPASSGSCITRMARAAGRANAGKCALTGAVMCLLFYFTGAAAYLAGGLILIYISLLALRRRRMPELLFEK